MGIIWSNIKEFARSYFYTPNFVEAQGHQAISEAVDIAEAKTIRSKRLKMDNFTIYDAAPTDPQKKVMLYVWQGSKKTGRSELLSPRTTTDSGNEDIYETSKQKNYYDNATPYTLSYQHKQSTWKTLIHARSGYRLFRSQKDSVNDINFNRGM